MADKLERMKAILAQAAAEAERAAARLLGVQLDLYTGMPEDELRILYEQASRGTPVEGVPLTVFPVGHRYICWNCCGLRFEGEDSACPNCGEEALEVPSEIAFALRRIQTG